MPSHCFQQESGSCNDSASRPCQHGLAGWWVQCDPQCMPGLDAQAKHSAVHFVLAASGSSWLSAPGACPFNRPRPPPADPVLVYRNDTKKGSRPSVKPAREFHLIWRQNGRSPVTMWEPLPPQGYRALGTVVVPDAEQPGSKEVLCIREDLCAKTGIFDFPIWKFEPPIMQVILVNFWCLFAVSEQFKCHVLQVDCQMLSVRQCIHVGTEQPIEA